MSVLGRDRDRADRGSLLTTSDLAAKKRRGELIVMVTAYDFRPRRRASTPRSMLYSSGILQR